MFQPLNAWCPKMVRHTLKILQYLLQDFCSVSDHFQTLFIQSFIWLGKTYFQKHLVERMKKVEKEWYPMEI